jgi:hypothetical protein
MWPGLSGPKKFTLREGSFPFPNTIEDTVACWVADFRKTLDLKKQSTQVDLFDGTVLEVVAE